MARTRTRRGLQGCRLRVAGCGFTKWQSYMRCKARGLVVVAFVLFGTVVVDDVSAASTPFLRIMPMGDSITEGSIPGSYRLPLYNLLQTNGYAFDFVGAKMQVGDTCPDKN